MDGQNDKLKDNIIKALRAFIAQRSGLERGAYGDPRVPDGGTGDRAYSADKRAITRDLTDAKQLIREVELSAMTAAQLVEGFGAYSGRLSIATDGESVRLDYTAGQYFPTEYRKAVCAVCARALWDHYREAYAAGARPGESAGDAIRRRFREVLGKRIADRWFR